MKKYDLIVAGGGLTGVAAAVAAARQGASVLLVERAGHLGGAMSNSLVFPFMKTLTTDPETKEKRDLCAGLFAELRQREAAYLRKVNVKYRAYEYFKFILDEMVTEAGVEVLFHATLCGVKTDGRRVTAVELAVKSGKCVIEAVHFVDATGDGDLFAFAGCDYQLGRASDGLCQPMTTCFRVSNVDMERYPTEIKQIQELYKQFRSEGKMHNPREDILVFGNLGEGLLHFNTTRVVKMDPTDPVSLSKAEMLARQQVWEMFCFLRNHTEAFRNSTLISCASEVGVRESRKLKGRYILTQEDLLSLRRFPDTIAVGNYDIDIHNPVGSGTSHHYFGEGEYYTIPYRSLLPVEYDNLLVAGRCLSATHEAQASTRIMPICCCLGEAAGTAVGVAKASGCEVSDVDISAVQEVLRKNGAVID